MRKNQSQVRGEAEMSTNSGKKRDSEDVRLSGRRDTLGRPNGLKTSGGDCRRRSGELANRLSWVGVSGGRNAEGSENARENLRVPGRQGSRPEAGDREKSAVGLKRGSAAPRVSGGRNAEGPEGARENLRVPGRRGSRLEAGDRGKSAVGLKRGSAALRVSYTGTPGGGGRISGTRSGDKSGLLTAGQRSRQTTRGGMKPPGLELALGSSAGRLVSKRRDLLAGTAETSNKKVSGVGADADQWMWDRFDSIMMALKDFSKDGGTYWRTNRARSTRQGGSLARILLAAGVAGAVATPSRLQGPLKNFSSLYFKYGTPDVITLRF